MKFWWFFLVLTSCLQLEETEMSLKRIPPRFVIPPGDTFQKTSPPLYTEVKPYPNSIPSQPGGVRILNPKAGGIADVDDSSVGNVGNALVLNSPAAQQSMAAAGARLWENPPNFPSNAAQTVILRAQARTPKNPEILTINLNTLTTQENFMSSLDADVKAYISFGIGNDRNIALVDFCQGTEFSVTATDVEVRGVYTLLSAIGTVQSLTAGAQISYGGHSTTTRPTFTARFSNLAPGVSSIFFIPPFAREVYLSTIDMITLLSVPSQLRFLANGPFQLGQYTLPANDTIWRPIPNSAGMPVIITNPATNPNNVQGAIIFGLGL